ncbi:MAG TPA: hypothetical protein VHV83_14225, partial [Armatimonadota bacterium]|nr:hypothetical protein [Armatimonadota bacterium]
VATRLMQFITDFRLDVNGDQVSLGISIGIGGISHGEEPEVPSIRPRHEFFQETMKMLISQADGLMYRAKHGTTTHIASGHAMGWSNLLQRSLAAQEDHGEAIAKDNVVETVS